MENKIKEMINKAIVDGKIRIEVIDENFQDYTIDATNFENILKEYAYLECKRMQIDWCNKIDEEFNGNEIDFTNKKLTTIKIPTPQIPDHLLTNHNQDEGK